MIGRTSNNHIAQAVYSVLKGKNETETRRMNRTVAEFLSKKGLLSKAGDILDRLNKIINTENKVAEVKISGATLLKEEFKKRVASFIKERYSVERVVFLETLEAKFMGGIKIEVNDEVIDLTARNKIKKLQEHLTSKI